MHDVYNHCTGSAVVVCHIGTLPINMNTVPHLHHSAAVEMDNTSLVDIPPPLPPKGAA